MTDKLDNVGADKIKEIWEVENWGPDEWAEQVLAEMAFAKVMNVQYVTDKSKLKRVVRVTGCGALRTVWCWSLRTTTRTSLWR